MLGRKPMVSSIPIFFGPCNLGLRTFNPTFTEWLLCSKNSYFTTEAGNRSGFKILTRSFCLPPFVGLCYSLEAFPARGTESALWALLSSKSILQPLASPSWLVQLVLTLETLYSYHLCSVCGRPCPL